MRRVGQFLTLARLTALEAVRQPICLLLVTVCVVLTALVPLILLHKFGEPGKLVRDSGFAIHFFLGLFVAGYAAAASLAREREKGTAAAVLSKPVPRELFFLAKFFGIAFVLLCFSVCACISTLISERVAEKFVMRSDLMGYITDWQSGLMLLGAPVAAYAIAGAVNFRWRRPFGSVAFGVMVVLLIGVFLTCALFDRTGAFAPFDFRVDWRILPVSALVTLALMVIAAIALALAARAGTVPTLTASTVIFLVGLMSDHLFGGRTGPLGVARVLYWITPNWQHFWVVDALNGGGSVPWSYVGTVCVYAVCYTAGVLLLGLAAFRHADVR